LTFTSLICALTLPLVANNNLRFSEKARTLCADTIVLLHELELLKEEAP